MDGSMEKEDLRTSYIACLKYFQCFTRDSRELENAPNGSVRHLSLLLSVESMFHSIPEAGRLSKAAWRLARMLNKHISPQTLPDFAWDPDLASAAARLHLVATSIVLRDGNSEVDVLSSSAGYSYRTRAV